jgi:hypothetical protein
MSMSGEPAPDSPARDRQAEDPAPKDPRRGLRSPSRRLQNAVVALALLAELVALIGHPLFGWGPKPKARAATPAPLTYHATLPPSGAQVLVRLAAAAARQSGFTPAAQGTYAYVERQAWQLSVGRSGSPPPANVIPVVTESWRASDGSGRVVTFIRGPGSRSAGRLQSAAARRPLPAMSTTPTVLLAELWDAAPAGVGAARELLGLAALAAEQPIPARVEAVALGLLARIPGVINSGTVTDRDGRAGVAVSLDSDSSGEPIRYTLIFAPASGALLEADQTLEGDPEEPELRPGAVIAYTTFLAAGYVDSTTARP